MDPKERPEIMISRGEDDPIAIACFTQQRKQEPKHRREVLFDVRRDNPCQRRPPLYLLHPRVETRENDDHLDAVFTKRSFQLVLGVGRIQWRDDRAKLPRRELSDHELRAIGQQQREPIAAAESERCKSRRGRIAQVVELAKGDRRALVQESRSIGSRSGGISEVVDERAVRIGCERPGHTRVVAIEPRR